MNEEILAGIKNAISRGSSLEEASQSFLNAGYNSSEVREAASFYSRGYSPLPTLQKKEEQLLSPPSKKEVSKKVKLIILILAALVVIGLALSFIFLRDKFFSFIDLIFP